MVNINKQNTNNKYSNIANKFKKNIDENYQHPNLTIELNTCLAYNISIIILM
jgi:hypothetical protein